MEENREKCPTCRYNKEEYSPNPCGLCLRSIDNCYYSPNGELLVLYAEWKRTYELLTKKCPWCEGKGKLTEAGRSYSEVK